MKGSKLKKHRCLSIFSAKCSELIERRACANTKQRNRRLIKERNGKAGEVGRTAQLSATHVVWSVGWEGSVMKVLEYLGGDPSYQAHLFRYWSVAIEDELKITRTRTNVLGTRYRSYLRAIVQGRPVIYFSPYGRVVADELFVVQFGTMVRTHKMAVFLMTEQKKVLARHVCEYVRCRDRQLPFPLVRHMVLSPTVLATASGMV